MLNLINNSSTTSLKLKLTFIYILNALDIIFTFSLLKTGLFYEANALMLPIVDNALLSICFKLLLPAILIIYVINKLDGLGITNFKICNILICIVLSIYFLINLLHIYYLYTYILL